MIINPPSLPIGTKILIRKVLSDDAYFPYHNLVSQIEGQIVTRVGSFSLELPKPLVSGTVPIEQICLISVEGEVLEDPDDNY